MKEDVLISYNTKNSFSFLSPFSWACVHGLIAKYFHFLLFKPTGK